MLYIIVKNILGTAMSIILILLLSPIFLLLILFLSFVNRGKAFFVQERIGKNNKIFRLIKFKTMTDERDAQGNLLPDIARLTKIGKFVRSNSLDELPQLINIIKGDMSLIGPRPLLVKYLPLYDEVQIRRHEVKSGITGWAQVNGRNTISWQEKFEHDVFYVDNISFKLDLKIFFLTIKKLVIREGINSSSIETMEEFKGNSKMN